MAAATAACRTGPNHALVRYNRLHAGFTTHPVRPLHASYEPRSISPKYHHGTVLRSDSDALCGEPECLVQSAQPVDCTQKGPETRAAKYGVRTFAVRAATLSVRSQIERFGKPVTVSRWQVKGPIVIRCKIGNDKRTTKLLFRLGTCLQTRFPPLRVCSFGNHALLPPPAARSSGRPPDGS